MPGITSAYRKSAELPRPLWEVWERGGTAFDSVDGICIKSLKTAAFNDPDIFDPTIGADNKGEHNLPFPAHSPGHTGLAGFALDNFPDKGKIRLDVPFLWRPRYGIGFRTGKLSSKGSDQVTMALTVAFLSGRLHSAQHSFFVMGGVVVPCCKPSVLTFDDGEMAIRFQRGFGVKIGQLNDALEFLQKDISLHAPGGCPHCFPAITAEELFSKFSDSKTPR